MNHLEEARLETTLDIDRSVNYEGNTYTYHPTFEWGTGDFADEYPVLVLTYDQEAGERAGDQPINDLLAVDTRPNEPVVDRHNVSRVRDLLRVTIAADDGRDDNGVPWHIIVEQTSMDVWEQLRFDTDLNERGPNGERPMKLRISGPPSGPTEEDGVIRSRFTIAADYWFVHTNTVDAVTEAETTENINQ